MLKKRRAQHNHHLSFELEETPFFLCAGWLASAAAAEET
jgi:hypothetical protein